MQEYQVAVIGGGPGGYETAIRLSQFGINTVVFEKERIGGVCLNWGCIPTKTLVKTAELYSELKDSETYGLPGAELSLDYEKVFERKNKIVEQLVSGIEYLFRKRKIPVVNDTVTVISKDNDRYILSTASGEQFSAEYLVLATGSSAKSLPGIRIDEVDILSSTGMLRLQQLPKSLAVVGGGVIGCEFASIMATFGVEVHIIEFLPRLISLEDEEISKRLTMALKKAGIKIQTGVGVQTITKTKDGLELALSNETTLVVEKALISVGRIPVCDIDWQGMELVRERGAIVINELMLTNLERVYAIGDVTAKLQLAHTASKQGLMVAEQIHGMITGHNVQQPPLNYANIPRCTFTHPEIGSVGLTEKEAQESYGEILVGRFPFTANGKAMAMSNTFGFVKTIARADTGELVGMHIIGPQAAELIAQGGIMISMKVKAEDVESMVFAHPTLSEAIMESLEDIRGLSIHKI
ncbi:MAG TPA: dihydrolipoyl dehydrogenase [Candidatus Cloacimonadota bacterium]|nr:dihydrolipoyl dehydrogenase [Candidatus Cloacimonadota bacterium]